MSTADGFTALDHCTEREPGPWTDCSFASMLEVVRLGFADGREIPATVAEKERLRAAAGLPDDHHGATMEQAVGAAIALYGMSGGWVITHDWLSVRACLLRPGGIAVVQGMMAMVPPILRRWDPEFRGAHAVVGRFSGTLRPTWCDPLAPKGTYAGENVDLITWCDYFRGLPGGEAFLTYAGHLERTGEVTMLPASDYPNIEPRTVDVPAGKDFYDLGGRLLGSKSVARNDIYSPGRSGDFRLVVDTWDGTPQFLLVRRIDVDDSRPLDGDVKHLVTMSIDGNPVSTTEV